MNPYRIVEMKINGDLISFKIEGPDGFCVWVQGIDEVEAVLTTAERLIK